MLPSIMKVINMPYDWRGRTVHNTKLFEALVKEYDKYEGEACQDDMTYGKYQDMLIEHDPDCNCGNEDCSLAQIELNKKYDLSSDEYGIGYESDQGVHALDHVDYIPEGKTKGIYFYDRGVDYGSGVMNGSFRVVPDKRGFQQVYSKDDFLYAMPLNTPITQNGIVKILKCSVPTAKKYLNQLEATGQVRQVSIIGSHNVNWEKIGFKTLGELKIEHDNLDMIPKVGEKWLVSESCGDVTEHLFLILPKPHVRGQWYRLRTCGCDAILSREQAEEWVDVKDIFDEVMAFNAKKSLKRYRKDCLDGRY
jgi:hypothetical protein